MVSLVPLNSGMLSTIKSANIACNWLAVSYQLPVNWFWLCYQVHSTNVMVHINYVCLRRSKLTFAVVYCNLDMSVHSWFIMEGSYNEKKLWNNSYSEKASCYSVIKKYKMLRKLILLANIMNWVEIYHMDSEPPGNIQLFTWNG